MKLIPVTEAKIKNILKIMKQKNSTGYDGVSSRILKYCKDEISKPLGHIFNVPLEQGVYPERMKYASLRAIYKTGEESRHVKL
jgi:hypothetical protein